MPEIGLMLPFYSKADLQTRQCPLTQRVGRGLFYAKNTEAGVNQNRKEITD